MDDERRGAHRPPTEPSTSDRDSRAFETTSRREIVPQPASRLGRRATAGAAALGASALLVLTFGPAALALDPSPPGTRTGEDSMWSLPLEIGPAIGPEGSTDAD